MGSTRTANGSKSTTSVDSATISEIDAPEICLTLGCSMAAIRELASLIKNVRNVRKRALKEVANVAPAPENDALYGPIDPDDPKIQQMATEMRQQRKCRTLLTLSSDFYVMDGHRRLTAGLTKLECVIDPMLHSDPEFVKELVRFNNQRIKSNNVLFREAIVSTSKGEVADLQKMPKEVVTTLKTYCESGTFARGKDSLSGMASIAMFGNTNQPVEVMVGSSHLFIPMPDVIRVDMAFLDRIHFYIPGWKCRK